MTEPEYDFMEMQVAPPEGAICDFCGSPNVHWSYPCRDHMRKRDHVEALVERPDGNLTIEQYELDAFSGGGWAACVRCHALVERGLRDQLARRAAKRMIRVDHIPAPLGNLTTQVRRLHDQFWENREGPPVYSAERPHKDPTR